MSNESNNEQKNRKIGRIVAVIVAVLVIAALVVGSMRKKAGTPVATDQLPEGCKPGYLFSETSGKPCPSTGATNLEQNSSPVESSAYEAALKQYAGKIIAFNGSCTRVVGISSAVAPGTRVLIANNSDKQISVGLNGRTETLDGYHYFTTTLITKGAVNVQCQSKDAATILVD